MNGTETRWFHVPEVWLMIVMLGATVAGSIALVATAYEHGDAIVHAAPPIASPLPPSHAPAARHDP